MNTAVIILALLVIVLVILFLKEIKKNRDYKLKYSSITNVEDEVKKIKIEFNQLSNKLEQLQSDFKLKKQIYVDLVNHIAVYDADIELIELGHYKPIFNYDTSEKYKEEIVAVRENQKNLMQSEEAIYCTTEWTVGGSKAKGKTFTNKIIKLSLRAFNNECDATITKVKWNNIEKMIDRIKKSFELINKLNETNSVIISQQYLQLKLEELQLAYEYENQKQKEKEEQADIRQKMKEEAQFEQDLFEAEKNEEKYQKLLEKAKKESQKLTGAQLDTLNEKIKALEEELKVAQEKNQRAKSMAEQTKSGHVYIISNVGSFGENIYKIGMTRRLEPLDRVKELGDASVPFVFDVHAVIYSDNAPSLENQLHKIFDNQRVNLVNTKREFFNVALKDIEVEVKKISPKSEFVEMIEAKEYRESLSIRHKKSLEITTDDILNKFPDEI